MTNLKLVEQSLQLVAATSARYEMLMPSGVHHPPLPFFGSLERAKIVTLGLNPSAGEFRLGRDWPVSIAAEALADRLERYFNAGHPGPHPWFQPWSKVLESLGVSYRSNGAHIDLSPRVTRSAGQFRREPLISTFLSMLQTDAIIWIEALRTARNCSLVLAAGSAMNDSSGYINEFIQKRLSHTGVRLSGEWRRSGPGHTAFQCLRLPEGREIPFFFCSTGPTMNHGDTLVTACTRESGGLRRILASTLPCEN